MSTNPKLHPMTVAQFYHALGYSLVPIPPDGTKRPKVAWKDYQSRCPTPAEIKAWFASGKNGIALIQGSVSGNAELLEFEAEEVYGRWRRAMVHRGHGDLADMLSLKVISPGGGVHLYYRHEDEPSGNLKIALTKTPIEGHKQGADGFTTLIETRGQGGYVLAPGCPPECHPSGRIYILAPGSSFKNVPVLTPEERAIVFSVCRELDERPQAAPKPAPRQLVPVSSGEGRPGEDFDERGGADALACLMRHGWTVCKDHGDWQEMMRPGKSRGAGSASFGKAAAGVLHVFSSNGAPFEMDSNTGPFGIVATLDFGGDFKACARFLASRGFGSPLPARSLDTTTRRSERYIAPDEPIVKTPDPQNILILARMAAVLRLCALELVDWPPYELLPKDQEDPEFLKSQEAGERIIRIVSGNILKSEVSVSVELLRRRQVLTLADCITSLESELETDSRIEAWQQLTSLDHWLDMADVYAEHCDCVFHYVDWFIQRFGLDAKQGVKLPEGKQ